MKNPWYSIVASVSALLGLAQTTPAGVAYPDPAGGWSYIYQANAGEDVAGDGASFDALDGTWSHNNGSDAWDGSAPGGTFQVGVNAPGGAKVFQEGGVGYLRIQDPGDPRDFNHPDPSNRKIYFGHDISSEGAPDDALDRGVTISFRARLPVPSKTAHPLDTLHRDGQGAAGPQPFPAKGDGYVTSDGGKGNFVIKQQAGGAFAFSLAVADDQGQGAPDSPKAGFTGLTMNEFSGNAISGNVNFGQGTGTNVLALDPTEWHEFWIVLRKDPANIGTHEALIYVDGSTQAKFFKITAGNGSDYGHGYLAMGSTATPQNSALDVDFFAYKTEATFPPGALANLPPDVLDLTPPRGTRYANPAEGLKFTGATQPPNSIPANGAKLVLNGRDVSSDLVASGDIRSRQFTYGKLEANQFYSGTVVLADQTGRSSTNAISFDTFVQGDIVQSELTTYSQSPSVNVPSGAYRLFLLAGATQPQTVRVEQVAAGGTSVLGTLQIPNTGTLDTPQVVQVSDAFGLPVTLTGGGGSATLRFVPLGNATSAPRELIVVPGGNASQPPYVAALVPPPGAVGAFPDTPIVAYYAASGGSFNAASAKLVLGGTDVTGQSTTGTTPNGGFIRYAPTGFLPSGTSLEAKAQASAGGAALDAVWSFSFAAVPALKASWKTDVTSVLGRARGFKGRIHKPRADADAALFPNTPERAAQQLANLIIDTDLGTPFLNEAGGASGDGSFVETETINYEQTGIDEGIPGDRAFPNLDAGDMNYIALEVITYLELPRGAHRLAVACDDGFVVWAGPSAARATNQFGIRSPGGSTTPVTFDVLAEERGVYAFRLHFFEGNGGADVEWYSIDPATGVNALINAPGGIAAYQTRSGDGTDELPPLVLSVSRAGAGVQIGYPSGSTLQSAGAASGPWTDVAGAANPHVDPASVATRFFRARR